MGFLYLEAEASKNLELPESLTIGFNGKIYDATDTTIIKLFSASIHDSNDEVNQVFLHV